MEARQSQALLILLILLLNSGLIESEKGGQSRRLQSVTRKGHNKYKYYVAPAVNTCTDEVQQQESQVLVEIGGGSSITAESEALLEQTFLNTYNSMADNCEGDSLRVVDGVTILKDPALSQPADMDLLNDLPKSTPYYYSMLVRGRCLGCSENPMLFDNNSSRRRQLTNLENNDNQQQYDKEGEDLYHYGEEDEYDEEELEQHSDIKLFTSRALKQKKKKSKYYATLPPIGCPECTAPSMMSFTLAYHTDVIQTISSSSSMTTTRSATNMNTVVTRVAEMQDITCVAITTEFSSNVLIDFFGNLNPPESSEELRQLELIFIQTYNQLNAMNPDTCDTLFRRITTVTLVDTQAAFNRRLQEGSDGDAIPFTFRFAVTGTCRGCDPDAPLFEDGVTMMTMTGGRALVSPSHHHHPRQLQQTNECVCAVGATEFRPPTRIEFKFVYEEAALSLDFVDSVTDVVEVDPVSCPASTEFETFLPIDFLGAGDLTTNFELTALENGFINSYNELSQMFCDPFFRTVLNATVVGRDEMIPLPIPEQRRDLQTEIIPIPDANNTNSTMSNNTNSTPAPVIFAPFRLRFRIRGRCRGCIRDVNLFDQGVQRRMMMGDFKRSGHRRLDQGESTCFCDVLPNDFRAPSEEEFEQNYNETVIGLELPTVTALLDIGGPTFAPSVMPSLEPTPQPTPNPSPQPTPQPSFNPSSQPTGEPSSQPTSNPSQQPTLNPSQQPTSNPSPQPTPGPTLSPTPFPTNSPTISSSDIPSSAPSFRILNQELFSMMFNFPYDLFDFTFGSLLDTDTNFPLYRLNSAFTGQIGIYQGTSTNTNEPFSVDISEIIFDYDMLVIFAQPNIDITSLFGQDFRPHLVFGSLTGSTGRSARFVAAVVQDMMIPFDDPHDDPYPLQSVVAEPPTSRKLKHDRPRRQRRKLLGAQQQLADILGRNEGRTSGRTSTIYSKQTPKQERRLQTASNTCDTFASDVANSVSCPATDFLTVDEMCIIDTEAQYAQQSSSILTAFDGFRVDVFRVVNQWLATRALEMAYGYGLCSQDVAPELFGECMRQVHFETTVFGANDRVVFTNQFDERVVRLEQRVADRFTDLCVTVVEDMNVCFTCQLCTVDVKQCCVNSDCVDQQLGNTCVSNVCITEGNPRFTLSWTGDDDLDLHVITPGGFEIYWDNVTDPVTGAILDIDDIPISFGRYVENIYFPPNSAPDGTYLYFVDIFQQESLALDEWLVQIFVDGQEVVNQTGSGKSEVFAFDYIAN